MLYLLGVLLVVLGVGLSIGLHEIGHLVPAKKFGVRVPQYMVGFGPTLWSTKRGETEYGVKAIPLGGYIRMIGMFPPRRGEDPNRIRVSSTGRLTQLMDEARDQSLSEVLPGDEDRVFYKLSVPKKVIIMLGGPTMNLLIAVVVFTGLFMLHGISQTSPVLQSVSKCVDISAAATSTRTSCTADMPLAPRQRGRPATGGSGRLDQRSRPLHVGRRPRSHPRQCRQADQSGGRAWRPAVVPDGDADGGAVADL
jgi:RIP metalloprotease RseP